MPTKTKTTEPRSRSVLVTTRTRDLYVGETDASDASVVKTSAVRLRNVRHVAYWESGKGGISSLVAEGPRGESRIGAVAPSALVTNVANVWDLTAQSKAAFDAMQPQS